MRDKKGRFVKGKPSERKGIKLSEEIKKKISESKKGCTPWNKGKPWSDESKRKMAISSSRDSDWHFIPKGFVIHHINMDKKDNRIENLACIPNHIHVQMHHHFGHIQGGGRPSQA